MPGKEKVSASDLATVLGRAFAAEIKKSGGLDAALNELESMAAGLPKGKDEKGQPQKPFVSPDMVSAIVRTNIVTADVRTAVAAGIKEVVKTIAEGKSIPQFDAAALA